MKIKFIVASTVGVVGLATMVIGASTFASHANTKGLAHGNRGETRMMQNKKIPMHQFENTKDAQAFRTAIDGAIAAKDYTAFKAAHTKYATDFYLSQEDFATMLTRRAEATTRQSERTALREQAQTALQNRDYTTWAELNKDTPMGEIITSEAKFEQLQEMHTYKEKGKSIAEELGLASAKNKGMKQGMKDGIRQGMGMRK